MGEFQKDDQVFAETLSKIDSSQGQNGGLRLYESYRPEDAKAIERRLVRKLDIVIIRSSIWVDNLLTEVQRIMPIIVVIYILNYIDRNSIAQARLYGIQEDAHIDGAMWNTALSILSVGYIAMQIPSTLYMAKTSKPSLFLPGCMVVWAVVSGCTAFVHSTGQLLVVRFFLGVVEAPFFPCAIYFLSCWYRKKELGVRMALLVSGLILSNACAGLLAAGIMDGMSNVGNLHAWQWLFILESLATIVVAIAAMFILPDYPGNTKWLTEEERSFAIARLAADVGSLDPLGEESQSLWNSLLQAAKDYRVWLFAGMQMCCTASISYSHFFPTIVEGLGFENNTVTLLLTSPPYILAFFWALSLAYIADRKQIRSIFAATSGLVALIGAIVKVALPTEYLWPSYAMMFLLCCGTYGIYCTTYTWLSSTIPRPPAKRSASIGIANSFANLASFYANYFWLERYGPSYKVSWIIVIVFLVGCLACIFALRFCLQRRNAEFDRLEVEYNTAIQFDETRLSEEELRAVHNNFRYVI